MSRSELAGWVFLAVMVIGSIYWALVGDWDYPDFRGAEFEFTEPTCDDAPHLCGTPVAVR